MDRLDTWLNAQRGWRRLLLMIATWYGSTLCLCCGVWGLSTSEFTLPTLDAAPGTASTAITMKGQPPFLMWRTTVGLWLLTSELLITVFIPHHGHHKSLFVLAMILLGGYFLLLVETLRYTSRFTRPREDRSGGDGRCWWA